MGFLKPKMMPVLVRKRNPVLSLVPQFNVNFDSEHTLFAALERFDVESRLSLAMALRYGALEFCLGRENDLLAVAFQILVQPGSRRLRSCLSTSLNLLIRRLLERPYNLLFYVGVLRRR